MNAEDIQVSHGFEKVNQSEEKSDSPQSSQSSMETWVLLQRRAWGRSFDDPEPEETLRRLGHTVEVTHL